MEDSPKKILLAVDGSEQSFYAIEYAAAAVAPGRAQFTLFHVLPKIPEAYYDLDTYAGGRAWIQASHAWYVGQKTQMEAFMRTGASALTRAGHPEDKITVTIQDRRVGIARDIAFEAQAEYDAVVVGRTGISRVKDIMLGSIANKLLGRLSGTALWFVGGKPDVRKVAIAVDPSEGARRALDHAMLMGRGVDVSYVLLHVQRGLALASPSMVEARMALQDSSLEAALDEAHKSQAVFLEDLGKYMVEKGVPKERVSTHLITNVPSRAAAIVEYAESNGCGTIVVGRRGLSKVQEFFMGRVGYKIMQLAKNSAVWVVA